MTRSRSLSGAVHPSIYKKPAQPSHSFHGCIRLNTACCCCCCCGSHGVHGNHGGRGARFSGAGPVRVEVKILLRFGGRSNRRSPPAAMVSRRRLLVCAGQRAAGVISVSCTSPAVGRMAGTRQRVKNGAAALREPCRGRGRSEGSGYGRGEWLGGV